MGSGEAGENDDRRAFYDGHRICGVAFCHTCLLKWQSECRTKVGMKKRARDYLSSKIFGRAVPDNQDFCWRQLNRDNLPGHTFTFWQWFYSVLGKTSLPLPYPNQNQKSQHICGGGTPANSAQKPWINHKVIAVASRLL